MLGALLVAGAGGWLAMGRDGAAGVTGGAGRPLTSTSAADTTSAAGSAAGPVASAASPASAPPAVSASARAVAGRRSWELPPEQIAEIEKQWCSHGQAAHLQAMAALDRAHPVDHSADAPLDHAAMTARADASIREAGYQTRSAVRQRLMQRWIVQLQARGDVRSRAAAAFIGISVHHGREGAIHMPALRALAEGGRDPLVWQLWRVARHFCFDEPYCGPATLKPWREIEPENLLAWLPEFREAIDIPEARWAGIRAARYARSYQEDYMGLLLPLVEGEAPGLALQEGLGLLEDQIRIWPTIRANHALHKACTRAGPARDTGRQDDCRRAAELLWTSPRPTLDDRITSLQVADANGAAEQAAWPARLSFVRALDAAEQQRFMETRFRSRWDEQPCDAQPRQRETLKAIAQGGEWAAALGPERSARTP